jgi:uncharacterized protein (DUF1499 family)
MNYVSSLGLALSVLSLLGLGLSGLGYRIGMWSYKTGVSIVKCAGFTSVVAVVVCLIGVALWITKVTPEGMTPALVGLVISASVMALTLKWKSNLASLPYIHDITTDTENPPAFVAILPLRANAENPAVYGGPEVAQQQLAAYPDLKPIVVNEPPHAAFTRAVQAAQDMGWKIVHSNPQSLRIEATDTTLWFGFQDDVVVRITPAPTGSRIDVRSVSRVGKSDLGTNARRIEAFLSRMV